MLLVKTIVDNPEFVIERLAIKNRDARPAVEKIVALDKEKRAIQTRLEENKAEQDVGDEAEARREGGRQSSHREQ